MGLTRRCKVPTSCVALGESNRIIRGVIVHHHPHRDATAVLCPMLDPACCGC